MKRIVALTMLVIGASLSSGAPAAASQAVSIDVAKIAVRDELAPGGEYKLPTFGVRNAGTDPTSYTIEVSYIEGETTLRAATEWFSFQPGTLTLAGGASAAIVTTLRIPPSAEPGVYGVLIGPRIVTGTSGPQVGAAAAARLTFTVEPSSPLDGWLRAIGRFILSNPWLLEVAAVAALAGMGWLFRRRFAISIRAR
jgi:hypothetical protein